MKPTLAQKEKGIEVFLGGTVDSNWREQLIPKLNVDCFNPIVDDWNEEAQKKEIEKRKTCDFVLYVLTPKMSGVYAVAEVTDDSNKQPEKTVLCILEEDGDSKFDKRQMKSMNMLKDLIQKNGGYVFMSLEKIANFFNKFS